VSNIPLQTREELLELILALKGTDDEDLSTGPGDDAHLDANALAHVAVRQQAMIRELDEQLTPKDATGSYLDRHGECNLPLDQSPRLPATPWYGTLTLTNPSAAPVPVSLHHALSHSDGNLYQTTADVTVPALSSAAVAVESTTTGASATKEVGTPLTFVSPPAGLSNQAIVASTTTASEDCEGDDDYRSRILLWLRESPGAGNAAQYAFLTRGVSGAVDKVFVYPRWNGRGSLTIVPLGEAGGRILDGAIITEIQYAMMGPTADGEPGLAEADTYVTVESPTGTPLAVWAVLTAEAGHEPDFDGTYTVTTPTGGDDFTRVRLTTLPEKVVVGKRVVVHFGTGTSEKILQLTVHAKGANYVDVEDPDGLVTAAATSGSILRSGSENYADLVAAVRAIFDALGPSRCALPDLTERYPDPDRESYPELLRAPIIAALKDVAGIKNVTLSTPGSDHTNPATPGAVPVLFIAGLIDLEWT
jgi:uncharacterized phage protein gp47/JayE